jgi:hypothetical protein
LAPMGGAWAGTNLCAGFQPPPGRNNQPLWAGMKPGLPVGRIAGKICITTTFDYNYIRGGQALFQSIRRDSPTLGAHKSVSLCADTPSILCIPPGFAFGFCVLSTDALVHYFVSTEYDASAGRRIYPFDPTLGIHWETDSPRMSKEDLRAPSWEEYLSGDQG